MKPKLTLQCSAILPAPRAGILPLSFAQQRLWFLEQLEPGNSAYNIARAFRIRGELNVEILHEALNAVVARHESLRTRFPAVAGEPVQMIAERGELPMSVLDLRRIKSAAQRESTAQSILTKEAGRLFDLVHGPLLRVTFLRLGDQEYVLMLVIHHILADGWSMNVLYRDLSVLYQAFSQKKVSPLPELPIQYADYVAWQREWLQTEVLQRQLAYWKQHLGGAPAVLELPTDRSRPRLRTFRGSTQSLVLSRSLSESLKTLAQRESATLYMTLLAAFNVLLHRYTGQTDIVIGSPIAGRTRTETEELIGYFANTLVLRTDLSGDPNFRVLLKRVRDVALGGYAHQDVPFDKLVYELQPERDLSYNPLFQVLLALHNTPLPLLELPGLAVESSEVDNGASRFDLALDLRDEPEGVRGWLEYNKDLFDATTISRMIAHFHTLMESIISDPDQRVSRLNMLTQPERRQLLVEWAGTSADHTHDQCLAELFEAQVGRTPDAVAVVCQGRKLTYRELNRRANQLAHYISKLGVKAEVPVGICVERSLDMIVGLVAILKAGGAYVPLDPDYPTERLRYILQDIQTPVILTQQRLIHRLPEYPGKFLCLATDEKIIAEESGENLPCMTTPENLAYVIFTSGSTGRPKGVTVCHRNVSRLLKATRGLFSFGEQDVWTLFHSYGFDFSVWELWGALLQGSRLVVVPREVAQSANVFYDLLRAEKVTILNQTPSAMRQLVETRGQALADIHEAGSSEGSDSRSNSSHDLSLRVIICGGEAFPTELVSPLSEWNVPVWNFYGPTEATVWTTIHRVALAPSNGDSIPIGCPIGDRRVYILDQNLHPVPVGITGELHIGGEALAIGYCNRSDMTAEKFIPDPFTSKPGGRLYKTGDLARYLPDGSLDLLGRIDNQVKIRGFRVELGEIENILMSHRAIRAAAVVVRNDTAATKRLIAYIVPDRQQTFTISDLRRFVEERLPEYMIPSAFVTLDALPLTPNGKIDRHALPEPDTARPELEQAFIEPRTEVEKALAQIWSEVLRVNRVGSHDNFFELGGHSLLAAQVASRVRNTFELEISLRSIFQTPTLAALAEHIATLREREHKAQALPLRRRLRDEDIPLSFAQERLWFMHQLEPDSPAYNIALAVRMTGHLDVRALQKSLDTIVFRHEALRTTFAAPDGIPRQMICKRAVEIGILDLSESPSAKRETELAHLLKNRAALPFDLCSDLMLRATLIRLAEKEHVFLLVMHHIVSDGWSIANFCQELAVLYDAFAKGTPPQLPDLGIQYADFAIWERERLRDEFLQEKISYWRHQLAGVPALQKLPTDRPRPPLQSLRGSHKSFVLSKELTNDLTALSQREGTTLFMTLLAALNVLLCIQTKQYDLVIGTPTAGRNQTEIEGLIGFFVNAILLRTDLSGDPTFKELLERVREVTLAAYTHEIPVTKLMEALRPERSLTRTSLSQVTFGFQNNPAHAMQLSGLTLAPVEVDTETTKTDLTLVMSEESAQLNGRLEYSTDLFEASTISRLVASFESLLQMIVADPEQRISQLAFSIRQGETASQSFHANDPMVPELDSSSGEKRQIFDEIFEDCYPLAPMQEGMIFHSLYAPQSGVDIEQMICECHEAIDAGAFQQAWQRVLDRHTALRTSFHLDLSGEPVQKVRRHVKFDLEEQDWRALSAAEQAAKLERYVTDDRQRGFEPSRAPLMRLALFELGEADYQFVWSFHHALLDGRSFSLILEEVFAYYEAFCRGEDLQREQPRPYRDYIDWLGKRDLARAEPFWREMLKGFTAPTPLIAPLSVQSPVERKNGHKKQASRLSSALTSALRYIAQQHQLTLNTLVQGAWAIILSRYSGEEDIVFGATRAGRASTVEGSESIVGIFIKTLPVRTQVTPGPSLLNWLKWLREQQIAVREYEHTPLVKVQKWSEVSSGAPLFETIVVFENYQYDAALRDKGAGWGNRTFRILDQTNYPLTLAGYAGAEQLLLEVAYDGGRFTDYCIERMLDHLKTVLEAIPLNLEQRLSDLSVLTETERWQLLVDWNETKRDYPTHQCIHQLFEAQAERTPDAVAVVFEGHRLTYGELNAAANRIAFALAEKGIGRGSYVPFLMDRSVEAPIAMLAIMKAGAAFVPLDIHWPEARIKQILDDLNSECILVNETTPYREEALGRFFLAVNGQTAVESPAPNPNIELDSGAPIYVIYTSGSTGKPKGPVVLHRGITNRFVWMNEFFGPLPARAALQTTHHVYDSAVWQLFWPLINGGKTIIPAPGMETDAGYLADLICKNEVTITDFVPSVFNTIVPQLLTDLAVRKKLQSLRAIIVGGEEITPSTTYTFMAQFPTVRVINLYGPTEASIGCICYEVTGKESGKIPIGKPIANAHALVLDKNRNLLPVGIAGELYLSGLCLGLGYLKDEEKTKVAFVDNPFPDIGYPKLYKTGDLVRYLPDGNIQFLGRLDHQIKIRGFRIELGEIESAFRAHPAVREAIVIAHEKDGYDKSLIAYIVSGRDDAPTAGELRTFVKQKLPEYMVPAVITFLDSLPLTSNGKLDRKALPLPDRERPGSEQAFVAPRTAVEQRLAAIWAKVLNLDRVGIHDNFFELGGHSLLATQVVSRVRSVFEIELPLRALFETPTVAELAALVEEAVIDQLERLTEGEAERFLPVV